MADEPGTTPDPDSGRPTPPGDPATPTPASDTPPPPTQPPARHVGRQGDEPTASGPSLGSRLASHPVIVVIGVLAALASIVGVVAQFIDRGSNGTAEGDTLPTTPPTARETAPSSTTALSTTTPATTAPSPLDDQAIANLTVIRSGDLSEGWTAFDSRTREASVASYEAVPECESVVPVIRGDGETAIAGRDVFFVDGNTAVSVLVTFYEDEGLARRNGPDLLLDLDYQRCVRTKLRDSIAATNPTATVGQVASSELPAPSYGQRTEAVSHAASFNIPELGDKVQFTDEWAIQIGRAVLLMTWSSDQEFDPFELQLFQTLGSRFEREMALYAG